ncbi:capsule biosynthesis protein [Acidisoma cladoniae]|jgi:capsular polysaccharide transport system permease protein|uniref:capsule biosynthesis protein n=1 Tax=Acidisoma cladoniae TaxID=3040935 RepID=UPI00254BF268|nr:capsule biosynthesis protein [Acidisoma sp. PAMC 29798]
MDGLDLSTGAGVADLFKRPDGTRPITRRPSLLARWLPFCLMVLVPTAVVSAYFFAIASPQYVSETQFVVRGQSSAAPGMLSSLLQTAGGVSASEDTYAVQDYVMSRAAARDMMNAQQIEAVFNRPGADAIARFPNPFSGRSFESFYKYYDKHVIADLDSTTGISTLKVITFQPEDSQRIAAALLTASEDLVNRMNARQRQNTISSSQKEVADAEAHLRDLGAQLATYRNQQAMLDPMKQSVPMLRDISDLQSMLVTTRIQIAQLRASAPDSPLIPVYQRRVTALQAQIANSNTAITGSDTSLVPKITAYDDLTLQQDLGEKLLASAMASLEAAKAQADRQQLYIDEIVPPNLPDYPAYPKALSSVAVVFASLLGLFLLAKLIISGAREHRIV